jgi:2-polyprenyl-6-methoxyphenol hydroxylase-like FAD-dependent oxidoreductase
LDVPQHSPDHEIFDAVIVGARLAGSATAMLMARRGMRVLVADNSCALTDTLSTHAFVRPGILQLQRWGLLDAVKAAGTPPAHYTTFTYADSRVPIHIEPRDGVDALYAPRRTVIDPILAHAAGQAGAEFRIGHRVRGLLRTESGRVSGVTGVDVHGNPFSIGARFVVGADGLHSTVARLVDAPYEHRGRYATATTYGYWSGVEVDGYEWVFRPNASGGIAPTNDNQVVVFANGTPERIGHGGIPVIESILRASAPELAKRLAEGRPPGGTRLFRAQPGFLRRAWGPGWALVGDAGYFKDPISAHGMTDALRDAELLARALIAAHDGADEAVELAEFQRTRDALSRPMLRIVDTIASHHWSDTQISDLLKQLAAVMRTEAAFMTRLNRDDVRVAQIRAA